MKSSPKRRYFIVKHDLQSFRAAPGVIWRTGNSRKEIPRGFRSIRRGDHWIEFAYVRDGIDREPCSLVSGFYQCTREAKFGTVPRRYRTRHWVRGWDSRAWMIKGKELSPQPRFGAVAVPPIDSMLGRVAAKQATIVPLRNAREFRLIRAEVKKRAFDATKVPVLGREPDNEQEVVSIVAGAFRQLGIRKILRIRTAFPDMLVQIGRKEVHLELEYDSISFRAHLGDLRKIRGRRGKFLAKVKDKGDRRPIAVLCWIDGDKARSLTRQVRNLRIFELQTLLREKETIRL